MASGGSKSWTTWDLPEGSPEYLKEAHSFLGTKEALTNGSSNPIVLKFIKDTIGGEPKDCIDTPWCAYFAGGILKRKGYNPPKNGMARSYRTWGEECEEELGAIVIFWRGKKDDGVTGHVGFLVQWDENYLYVLGGNQGDRVCVQQFTRAKLLGFRRPKGLSKSRTIISQSTAAVSETARVAVNSIPAVTETVDQIKTPLEQLAEYSSTIKIILTVVTISCILLTIFYRVQDAKNKGHS